MDIEKTFRALSKINLITECKGNLLESLSNIVLIKNLFIKVCSCIKYTPNVKGPIKLMILNKYILYFI